VLLSSNEDGERKGSVNNARFVLLLLAHRGQLDIQIAVESIRSYDLLYGMYELCYTTSNGMNGEPPSSLGNSLGTTETLQLSKKRD